MGRRIHKQLISEQRAHQTRREKYDELNAIYGKTFHDLQKTENAKRGLEKANRNLEDSKRELEKTNRKLEDSNRDLVVRNSDLISECGVLQNSLDSLRKEKLEWQREKEDLQNELKKFGALKEDHAKIQEELARVKVEKHKETEESFSALLAEKTKYFIQATSRSAEISELDGKLVAAHASIEALKKDHESEKNTLTENVIRDFRQSKQCYNLKAKYGVGFLKFGFYKARQHLEETRGESFPELVYTSEIEKSCFVDWVDLSYAPNDEDVDTHLDTYLYDDLENLSGPWDFYGEHGVCARSSLPQATEETSLEEPTGETIPVPNPPASDDRIGALADLDEVDDLVEDPPGDSSLPPIPFVLAAAANPMIIDILGASKEVTAEISPASDGPSVPGTSNGVTAETSPALDSPPLDA